VTNFPQFHLSDDHYQAEIALSVLTCFGNKTEKLMLRPKAQRLRQNYLNGCRNMNLIEGVANIIKCHIDEHGALSHMLETFLAKSPKLLDKVNAK
jgi:hypothetical protein